MILVSTEHAYVVIAVKCVNTWKCLCKAKNKKVHTMFAYFLIALIYFESILATVGMIKAINTHILDRSYKLSGTH